MDDEMHPEMKDEYDFSEGVRGRFYRPRTVLAPAVRKATPREEKPLPEGNIYDTK